MASVQNRREIHKQRTSENEKPVRKTCKYGQRSRSGRSKPAGRKPKSRMCETNEVLSEFREKEQK